MAADSYWAGEAGGVGKGQIAGEFYADNVKREMERLARSLEVFQEPSPVWDRLLTPPNRRASGDKPSMVCSIETERLMLTPLGATDAEHMLSVGADERLPDFIGGHPSPLDQLRDSYRASASAAVAAHVGLEPTGERHGYVTVWQLAPQER